VLEPSTDKLSVGKLGEVTLPWDLGLWEGQVDDAGGLEQVFVQTLCEAKGWLEGWGVEGEVQKVGKARSLEGVFKAE
jgi:hypothetical protein